MLLSAGCAPARAPVLYPITLRVVSDSHPMAGASLLYHDRLLGTTDSEGTFRMRTTGQEGQLMELTLRCPDGFTSPTAPLPITLHSTIGLNGQQNDGIVTTAQCPPSQRVAAIIVRTPNRANIKVMYQGHEITRTDAQGYAHMIFRVPPNELLSFRLDTTEQPLLVPASPTQSVTTRDQDDVYVVSQTFDQLAPARAPPRPHGPVHTIIRVPARNGRLF